MYLLGEGDESSISWGPTVSAVRMNWETVPMCAGYRASEG